MDLQNPAGLADWIGLAAQRRLFGLRAGRESAPEISTPIKPG
jgi:hypothetical protein